MSIAKAINYRGNIVIDYVSYRDHLRIHIGISKIPKDESIFKNGQFTAKKENYINLNIQINNQLNEVNDIINSYLFPFTY